MNNMRRPLGVLAILAWAFPGATFAGQSSAAPPAPAPQAEQPFQVVRLGDGDMTCEALVGEINALNAQVEALQMEMMNASNAISRDAMNSISRGGGGAVDAGLGLANMAAGFIPGAGVFTGAATAVRQQANQAALIRDQQQMMERAVSLGDGAMTMAPMANRAQHLSEIARSKGC